MPHQSSNSNHLTHTTSRPAQTWPTSTPAQMIIYTHGNKVLVESNICKKYQLLEQRSSSSNTISRLVSLNNIQKHKKSTSPSESYTVSKVATIILSHIQTSAEPPLTISWQTIGPNYQGPNLPRSVSCAVSIIWCNIEPAHNVIWPCVLCLVSSVLCFLTWILNPVSCALPVLICWCPVSCVQCPVSCVLWLESCFLCPLCPHLLLSAAAEKPPAPHPITFFQPAPIAHIFHH